MLINYGNIWKFVKVFMVEKMNRVQKLKYRIIAFHLFFLNHLISLFVIPLKRIIKKKKEKYRIGFIFSRG